jgi:deoxyribose-phosphate aldolase
MQWYEAVEEHLQSLKPVTINQVLIQRIISLLDLTNLNARETAGNMTTFFEKAQGPSGHVAAVCVHPAFVCQAISQFANTPVAVASVANFPEGTTLLERVLMEIGRVIQDGAQEVDVVFPYQRYLSGERQYAQTFVESCKAVCGDQVMLKVILETGALSDPTIIADASYDVLSAGADFIKTSTGQACEGATLDAAATILLVIKHISPQLKRPVGFKISGGIREIQQAAQYIELADNIMGQRWVTSANFRIGASHLMDTLLKGSEV